MSEFEDKLNAVLNDAESMSKIMELAQSIGGNNEISQKQIKQETMDISPLMSIASQLGHGAESRYTSLLNAIKPYLKEERQTKLEQAVRISKLSKIAKTAIDSGLIGEL